MSLSRRGFLIGAGSLLTTAFVKDARSFIRTTGRPLLAPPPQALQTLYGYPDNEGYVLSLGEWQDPPPPAPTWREFFISEGIPCQTEDEIEWLCNDHGIEPKDLDGPVADWYWTDHIQGAGSTSAKAHRLLSSIHPGPDLQTGNAPQLKFHCGEVMGDNSSWVTAQDELSLSLLQARLIDLKMPIKVVEGEPRW